MDTVEDVFSSILCRKMGDIFDDSNLIFYFILLYRKNCDAILVVTNLGLVATKLNLTYKC